ncbi:uncharacterized protein LOC130635471 isoform X3 [Hydractinia symbiolongicarpus]|uniref:uncharacterized protein LOC130635471 isoform X3 n=1 Tax=Hydractinia symbiolongicarpus TaxID=13093 RepID=UPI002551B942|nr:uncharacterized protein LOC130635471 isoform X3 [Hydractinia symbiolongicarpus]
MNGRLLWTVTKACLRNVTSCPHVTDTHQNREAQKMCFYKNARMGLQVKNNRNLHCDASLTNYNMHSYHMWSYILLHFNSVEKICSCQALCFIIVLRDSLFLYHHCVSIVHEVGTSVDKKRQSELWLASIR